MRSPSRLEGEPDDCLRTGFWNVELGDGIARGDAVSGRYAEMRDKVHDAADQGRRTLHDRQDQAYALAQEARSKAQSVAEETTQSLKHLLEEQPILMAALGAALGAAIGAALPLSRQEKELLGGVGATAVGAGRVALSSAAGVLREEVAHADLGAKVSDLADKMVQGVTNGSSKS